MSLKQAQRIVKQAWKDGDIMDGFLVIRFHAG